MSYIFSRALVEAYLPGKCLGIDAFAQWNGTNTRKAPLSQDKTTEPFQRSRFGMTFRPLTENVGEELLTLLQEDSHAKTSAWPEKGQELTEPGLECGHTWRELWAKYDHVTSSWKTLQPSLLEDSDELSPTWPRSGMTADGQCWALPMLGRRTSATDCGFWPTPTVCGNYNRKGASKTSGDGLATAVRMWPTPQASDNRNRGNADTPAIARRIAAGKQVMLTMTVTGGQLSPDWVEWLMGWPIGHTDLKPLETDKSQQWQQQHGKFLEALEDAQSGKD